LTRVTERKKIFIFLKKTFISLGMPVNIDYLYGSMF
jgi:hypothetical protein